MAPINTLSPSHSSQRSILSLDKSTAPFRLQIQEACEFLSIQLPTTSDIERIPDQPRKDDPKKDWALRWLLKNLRSRKLDNNARLCLVPQAWLLFSELIAQISLTTTSRLLKAYEFPIILRDTLRLLEEKLQQLSQDEPSNTVSPVDSSSATLDANGEATQRPSKRRRLGEERSETPTLQIPDVGHLYTSITSALSLLLDLAQGTFADVRNIAVEHLKAALSASPDDAADFLASTFAVVSFLLKHRSRRFNAGVEDVDISISLALRYWEQSQASAKPLENASIPRCFSRHCLLPTLQLLHDVGPTSCAETESAVVSRTLEDLIIKHTLLPARLSHLNSTQPRNSRDSDIPTNLLHDLLAPITASTNVDALSQESMSSTVRMFRIALRCRFRSTPKQRRIEQSWLQELFVNLAESSAFFEEPITFGVEGQSILSRFICRMLQSAIDSDFRLDSPVLERILKQLFENIGVSVEGRWKVIQLCMTMDPDLFTAMSRQPTVGGRSLQESSNNLLHSLSKDIISRDSELYDVNSRIDDILDECLDLIGDTTDISYDEDLKDVTIQLVRAFAQSRRFPSFLHYWQEQMLASQQSDSIWHESLWWGLWLQQAVEALVEPSLTVEQVQKLLSTIADELATSADDGPMELALINECTAKLIMLDCIISGCRADFTIGRLTETVSLLYKIISKLVMQSRSAERRFASSLWKVLATINERWPKREDLSGSSLDMAKAAFSAIMVDSEEIVRLGESFPSWTKAHAAKTYYNEKLQAFKFIVSSASLEIRNQRFTSNEDVYTLTLGLIEIHIDRFRMSEIGKQYVGLCSGPWWNGRAEPRNREQLAIACLAHIVQCQPVLFHLTREVRSRVFREVYDGALKDAILMSLTVDDEERESLHLYRSRRYKSLYLQPDTQIHLPQWLWTRLVELIFAGGDPEIRAHFCDFLVAKYLQHSGYDQRNVDEAATRTRSDGLGGGVIRANDAALELLQAAPMTSFTKVQRINVANRIVQQLVNKRFGRGMIAEALHVLTNLIRFPTKSVISKEATLPPDSTDPEHSRSEFIILFAISSWLDVLVAEPDVWFAAVTELKHLTIALLEYLTLNSARSGSAEYLLALYRHVKATLNRGSSLEHGAATSALFGTLLEFYCRNDRLFPAAFREEFSNRALLRRSHFISLGRSLDSVPHEGSDIVAGRWRARIFLSLQTVGLYSDLFATHGEIQSVIDKMMTIRDLLLKDVAFSQRYQVELHSIEQVLGEMKRQTRSACESPSQIIESELSIFRAGSSPMAMKRKLAQFQHWAASLDAEELVGLLDTFVEDKVDRMQDFEALLLLESVLAVAIPKKECAALGELSSRIFGFLNGRLLQGSTIKSSIVATRCMTLILKSLPKSIAQHHIDVLLSAVDVTASRLDRDSAHKYIGALFHGLCKLFATALLLHRKKLGGRYHLIIPALQSLLGCLFAPYDSSGSRSRDTSQPAQALPLSEGHAAAYARLLTGICDPTVSSVSRSKRSSREELNDETKKARDIAGQHMQPLIAEYCECQLKGRLSPEMRAALNPGVYAVFAVMQQDVMRNLNAAMGSSSRSIFKALYDEYKRQGQRSGA